MRPQCWRLSSTRSRLPRLKWPVPLIGSASSAPPAFAERLDDAIEDHRRLDLEVDRIAVDASLAQAAFENWTDERIDGLLLDVAKALAGSARRTGHRHCQRNRNGQRRGQDLKNRFASLRIYASLAGKIAQGSLSVRRRSTGDGAREPGRRRVRGRTRHQSGRDRDVQDPDRAEGAQRADPELSPSGAWSRPTDGRHRARRAAKRTARRRISCSASSSRSRKTTQTVHAPSGSVARSWRPAAGPGEAAYSSGTPAIGVGPGNAPAWICADADVDRRGQRDRDEQDVRQRPDLRGRAQPGGGSAAWSLPFAAALTTTWRGDLDVRRRTALHERRADRRKGGDLAS